MIGRHCYRSAAALVALACLAAVPATGPGAAPTTQRSCIDEWLIQAADIEPAIREAARINLLGLKPDELPLLHDAATAASPLKPAQAELVREAVTYIRTRAGLMQMPNQGSAFMGVLLGRSGMIAQGPMDTLPSEGVLVVSRLPGLAAARYLQDGDMILGFVFDQQTVWFDSKESLRKYVTDQQIGTPVTMLVRRASRVETITFPLDPCPTPQGTNEINQGDVVGALAINAENEAMKTLDKDFGAVAPAQ